ncbi:MAG: tyrosine-type recombinase/integrase [Geminicoccaceae bacterium]
MRQPGSFCCRSLCRRRRREGQHPDAIYRLVRHYARLADLPGSIDGISAHAMRATAATNALQHQANIAKVQEWLGHAHIGTTRSYDRRKSRPEGSPTFRVRY